MPSTCGVEKVEGAAGFALIVAKTEVPWTICHDVGCASRIDILSEFK
jgi:hypothetical protein